MATITELQMRLSNLRRELAAQDAPAFALTNSVNISYLTGMGGLVDEEDPHCALVTADEALLFTDSRYVETARQQASLSPVIASEAEGRARQSSDFANGSEPFSSLWQVEESRSAGALQEVARALSERSITSVLLEDTMSYRKYQQWESRLAQEEVAARGASLIVEGLRRHKDASEVAAIAAAQDITDAAFAHMLAFMKIGMTELEIAAELEHTMRLLGASGLAFPSIIASGPNGAKPHAVPSSRQIEPGDLLVMDFGAQLAGYCSDMTRTVAFGDPGQEARQVYELVAAAQLAALGVIAAGKSGKEVHESARAVIVAGGYGDNFGHGLSHGLGLKVHETPACSQQSPDILEAGDVISVEPGIYLPGRFGVRIEDLVTVTTEGLHNFTASPKELIIL